jgi:Mrp family chromosome partitioning ATPase
MSDSRFVVATLARPRASWHDPIVQLANSGGLPIEVRKCVGVIDLLSQLTTGHPLSAVLLDGGMPGIDRDLILRLQSNGLSVMVVSDAQTPRDWPALGANVTLPASFEPHDLLDALQGSATSVHEAAFPETTDPSWREPAPWDGACVAVVGSGGSGVSTVAIAAAQGLGNGGGRVNTVALADFCLCAEQSMLHDADPAAPGLLELLDLCRLQSPEPSAVRSFVSPIHKRGYDLLPGLRRRRLWTQLRGPSSATALKALRQTYAYVVADLDGDFEGESESGSIDVEERNQLARLTASQATVVLAVGHASMKGLHSLTRVIRDLADFNVDPSKIQPVFNLAPPNGRARAGYTAALAELTDGVGLVSSPVFVPTKDIDDRLRALVPFPTAITDPIAGSIRAHIDRATGDEQFAEPVPVKPGFLRRNSVSL